MAVALGYNKVQDAEKNVHIGANYKVGPVAIAGSIVDPAGDAKGFTIGAGMQAGPVYLVLDIARDTHFKDTNVLVEAKYPLSKRTFAYAAFVRDGDGKTATSSNNLGLGLRHNF